MASSLTRGFMFRPRLTEFEGRLTPSTALDNHTYTPPPQNTSPATTDNDNMGTAPPGDTTNDGMGSADPHDTTNDDMGSGDGTAGDPGNGVSGTPPGNNNPPTDNPPPAGSTVIGGPGRLPYPPGSLAVVIQDSAGGDAAAIRRQLSGDSRVADGVTSWEQLCRELAKAPAGSLGSLIFSGHGYVLGGVCGTAPGGEITYTLAIPDLMNDPATLAMIKKP